MSDPTGTTGIIVGAAMEEGLKMGLRGLSQASGWLTRRGSLRKAGKEYDQRLRENCDKMRVLSMREPKPLKNIYTHVNILESITAYDGRTLEELERSFDRDTRSFGIIKEKAISGMQAVNKLEKFILLGKPGSGKTTFLKYVALQALDGKLTEQLIPVFVGLKSFADSGESLPDFIAKEFDICEFPEPLPYVQQILEAGRCILLLDGLDEVNKKDSHGVIQEINELADTYRRNRFITSCRIAAYSHSFQDFTDVELTDFTDEQIQNFVNNWFSESNEKAELFWSQLHDNEPIKELASIPLLLTLFCITFGRNMELPRNRAELYQDAVEVLLREWDSNRSIKRDEIYQNLSPRRKVSMFSRIAAETFDKDQFFLPHRILEGHIARFIENLPEANEKTLEPDSKVILRAIEAQHGIFVQRAKGIYSFSHLTLQEYFTANYVIDNAKKGTLETLIENHFTEEKWREVFLITAGMLEEADDFLLMLKEKADALLEDKKVAAFLKSVRHAVVREGETYHFYLIAYGIYVALILARDRASALDRDLNLARARDLVRVRVNDPDFARNLARVRDRARDRVHDLDITLARDRVHNPDLLEQLSAYLRANQLLVDCLNTECYISKATRQKIMDELLTIPQS